MADDPPFAGPPLPPAGAAPLPFFPDDPEAKAFADGMEMIYRQLLKNLEGAGVTPMDCLGKPFDPNYHNAVMHVEDETVGENTIVEVFQKGYMYRDTVLRFSMVKVAN